MFADLTKILVKAGLVAVVTAGVIGVFAIITIPSFDASLITSAMGVGLAVFNHYFQAYGILYNTGLVLFDFWLALQAFNVAMIAVRWIFKVNE